jgi:anti-sigma factor RsiW
MDCAEVLRTQALIDGELDEAASRDAQAHIDICAQCQAFVADAAMSSDLLRRVARARAPVELRLEIGKKLATASRRDGRRTFWLGAGSGAGAMALAAGLALFALLPPSAASLSEALADAHIQAMASGAEIQVASSNHHTVKPWFAGRIDVSPPVADFAAQGFSLVGGRIARVKGIEMAVLVYRHDAHRLDLFVWTGQVAAAPGLRERNGYLTLSWTARDLHFTAVSDMERAELEKFSALVRNEPE